MAKATIKMAQFNFGQKTRVIGKQLSGYKIYWGAPEKKNMAVATYDRIGAVGLDKLINDIIEKSAKSIHIRKI